MQIFLEFALKQYCRDIRHEKLKVCARHARLKDILDWKHLVNFMNTWSLLIVPRLIKRLRLIVWKIVCRVFESLLASQCWIIWKVCQLNYKEEILTSLGHIQIDIIKSEIQCLRDDIGVEFQRWHDETKQLYILKRKCLEFRGFSVIGRMYLLTHVFFITRE